MTDSKMYTAEVILDSISEEGHRITTVKVIYPHAVHKDMLRHRCMNRNVESFRAQPPEKLIKALRSGHAFKPDVFAKRTQGMGQSVEEVQGAEVAAQMWDAHVLKTCALAGEFIKMDVAKQQVNFLLQDLCPLTEIITATDWSNFYALRTELKGDGTPVARPEVYKTAVAIRDVIEASRPTIRTHHIPMLTSDEWSGERVVAIDDASLDFLVGVSAGRCAKISYGDYDWTLEDRQIGYDRSRKLLEHGHMSPFEQQARPFSRERWEVVSLLQSTVSNSGLPGRETLEIMRQLEYSGNLCGWTPARKMFENEWDYGLLRASS